MTEAKEPLKLYLDDEKEPFKVAYPPVRFHFNTIALPDGPHRLKIEASNGLAPPTIQEIPFTVRNGVAISVYGLEDKQTIAGQVEVIINAYAGNTEVDFEPRRAETPQPIPTWAWVLFLGVAAWAMFYVFNPKLKAQEAAAASTSQGISLAAGQRIFADACARCHAEDGSGQLARSRDKDHLEAEYAIPYLRDRDISVEESPQRLLKVVTAGLEGTIMPAWGPRLTNEEILSVVNFIRSSWNHSGSQIEARHRTPPQGVRELEAKLLTALRNKSPEALGHCCWPQGTRPQLFRTDGVRARGADKVGTEWQNYFIALGEGK